MLSAATITYVRAPPRVQMRSAIEIALPEPGSTASQSVKSVALSTPARVCRPGCRRMSGGRCASRVTWVAYRCGLEHVDGHRGKGRADYA